MAAMRARMVKEIEMLTTDPPYGVSAWVNDERLDCIEAQIIGPEGSPYENGLFLLQLDIPETYPFEPPKVKFLTPIYHPNIDDGGRICLDTLKMPPKGSWLPSVNISTLLTTIRLLMAEPNADDGLMPDITEQFRNDREFFATKAKELTAKHAHEGQNRLKINTMSSQQAQSQAQENESSQPKMDQKAGVASELIAGDLEKISESKKRVRCDENLSDSFSYSDDDSKEDSDWEDNDSNYGQRKIQRISN